MKHDFVMKFCACLKKKDAQLVAGGGTTYESNTAVNRIRDQRRWSAMYDVNNRSSAVFGGFMGSFNIEGELLSFVPLRAH